MKLYLTHATSYDYKTDLYEPLKKTIAVNHDIFFPHDEENVNTKSKDIIKESDVVLAEVSQPSTGQGIELGWADSFNVPIVCFYRSGSKPSGSLRFISNVFIEFSSVEEMTAKLAEHFEKRL